MADRKELHEVVEQLPTSELDAALRYQGALLEEKHIQVRKKLPDILVASVYPGDFLQMVSNLVRNAAEASPAGGALCVRLRVLGAHARLTVADGGPGIPLPIQARLFEAFQSDKADAGNGLGLWICKTIVDKHEGSIRWRSSTEGKAQGTTFSILLPLDGPTENDGFGEHSYIAR